MGSGGSFLRQHNGNLIVVGGGGGDGATGSREFDFVFIIRDSCSVYISEVCVSFFYFCLCGLRDHVFDQIRVFDQMCSIYRDWFLIKIHDLIFYWKDLFLLTLKAF